MTVDVDVRTLTEADYPDWLRTLHTGFLRPPVATDEDVADRLSYTLLDRTLGAFDDGRCVATFRTFPQQLTAVGGRAVAADAISNVTVLPTHRRRGLLGRMMAADLAAAKERGEIVATLIAAEYPIYGRYGFGPGAWAAEWEIDVPRTGLDPRWSGPGDGGRIDLVDGAEVRRIGPALHERLRGRQHGCVDRSERGWRVATGVEGVRAPGSWTEPYYAVYRSADGEAEGLAVYSAEGEWWGDTAQPHCTARVRDLIATSPAAERALWRYLCSVDWITKVRSGPRAPDDLLPYAFPDVRAARIVTLADWLWVRLLDVPAALEGRTYPVAGTLVLEVADRQGLAGGRFRLDAKPAGAQCVPTEEPAELSLGIGELSTLWLGDESVGRLVDLGKAVELRSGAAAVADALFRAPRRAWCPDLF
ncbi:GNAT family N-acetyltransferase [Streptomyces triticagri]|uniref:GNAT family N-acetyltransferase n=1 Tax=Streptomyces triticagri TaxID=2293568 RepID=A0A372M519_9ACTN|nr:GNAT family N-acetyltransferase [Streptomyces triticagri]RFU85397.1 GNAT family N-acetyltransferase [Streptomyces triticagri]